MAYQPQINYPTYQYQPPYQYQPVQPLAQPLAQQTMNQMQQAPMAQQPVQPTGFGVRAVTSREEALGVQVDFFSPGTVMPDLAHQTIYLKRFNQNTGASDLYEFRLTEPARPEEHQQNELEEIKAQIQQLQEELERLKTSKTKVVKKNDDE